MASPARRRAAWILGIVLAVLAVAASPVVGVLWGEIGGDAYATFEDSVLGAALVCVPVFAAGAGLWAWGRRGAMPSPHGAPRTAGVALGLSVAGIAAPWAGALASWEKGGFFIGVAATVLLAAGGAIAGAVARGRSPQGSAAHRRASAAIWLALLGFAGTLVLAALIVIAIAGSLE